MTVLPLGLDATKSRRQQKPPLLSKQNIDEFSEGGFDGASFSGAVFNLSTTIVGAGIMALPAAVKVLGLVPGIIMIVFVAFLTRSSIDMILRAGRPSSSPSKSLPSYAGVVGEVFGGSSKALLQICIIVNNLVMLVVYMIIIGDVLSGISSEGNDNHHAGVVEEWMGQHWWTTRSKKSRIGDLHLASDRVESETEEREIR